MEKYKKPDQYYIDEYDRTSIEDLKRLEQLMNEAKKRFKIDVNNFESEETNTDYIGYEIRYNDAGVNYARNKENIIQTRKLSDERKDRILQSNPIPANIKCNTCLEPMRFELHDFIGGDDELIFFFSCINNHTPRKAVYPDGGEYSIPKSSCPSCGG